MYLGNVVTNTGNIRNQRQRGGRRPRAQCDAGNGDQPPRQIDPAWRQDQPDHGGKQNQTHDPGFEQQGIINQAPGGMGFISLRLGRQVE